jgi:hypothetical protein
VKLLDDIFALGNAPVEEPKTDKEADHEDKHFYIEALNNTLSVCLGPKHLSLL